MARRAAAAEFSFERLSTSYAALFAPEIERFKTNTAPKLVHRPPDFDLVSLSRLRAVGGFKHPRNKVIPAHDGGFFSLFNVFFSHLVWDKREDQVHRVLPDWDVGRFIRRQGGKEVVSFCYGQPEDGNIWTRIFKPLYGLNPECMN